MDKKDEFALELSAKFANVMHPNDFGDSLVETAKSYKRMTGIDLGIKDLEDINWRVKNPKKWWQFWRKF